MGRARRALKIKEVATQEAVIHKFIVDKTNKGVCFCGEERQFPFEKDGQVVVIREGDISKHLEAEVSKSRIWKKHEYYEKNKDAIIADLMKLGRPETRKKWNMSGGSLAGLERRWLTPRQRKAIPSSFAENVKVSQNGLPEFPPFSNDWTEAVQLKWLDVYVLLK